MSKLTIQSGKNKFNVSGKAILNLELKLNITPYGHSWKDIGDHLFNFYNKQGYQGQPSSIIEVTYFQYEYLNTLNQKTLEEVEQEHNQSFQ
tara:strand:- start:37 stop:309 length:273 start_codon:yes stop_codon:yes gene_type:complete